MTEQLCETCKQHLEEAARDAGAEPRLVVLDCRTYRKVAPLQLDGQGDVEGSVYEAPTPEAAMEIIHEVRESLPVGERFLVLVGCNGPH